MASLSFCLVLAGLSAWFVSSDSESVLRAPMPYSEYHEPNTTSAFPASDVQRKTIEHFALADDRSARSAPPVAVLSTISSASGPLAPTTQVAMRKPQEIRPKFPGADPVLAEPGARSFEDRTNARNQATAASTEYFVVQTVAAVPVAFVAPDSAEPAAENKERLVEKLQDDFVEAIGGPDQNPADPAYLDRWKQARVDSDAQFKALFGWQAFLARERQMNLLGDAALAQ